MDEMTKTRIRKLLEAGALRGEIAAEIGVSPSTVTRWARVLGFGDSARRPSTTDWSVVQEYYDDGHTIVECRERFGFNYGSWDKAVARGEITPRKRSNGELGLGTRAAVESLLSQNLTQAEIARELSITKSTVAFHVRKLGVRADPRFARRHDWAAVQRAVDDERLSMRRAMERFGVSASAWADAVKRGELTPRPRLIPLEELLVEGRTETSRAHLKRRLIDAGLMENRCKHCEITHWRGQPLALQLHHINGSGHDNRLENLELLCPNCHSLTENWGGRNGHRKAASQITGT